MFMDDAGFDVDVVVCYVNISTVISRAAERLI